MSNVVVGNGFLLTLLRCCCEDDVTIFPLRIPAVGVVCKRVGTSIAVVAGIANGVDDKNKDEDDIVAASMDRARGCDNVKASILNMVVVVTTQHIITVVAVATRIIRPRNTVGARRRFLPRDDAN
jgi:hypothetical protein